MQYENMDVWLRSRNLAVDVYKTLSVLSDFGFKSQITRAILSVPSNIAEGCERLSLKEKVRFLDFAKGSIGEFKTQVDIGIEIGYIDPQLGANWMDEAEQISKILGALIRKNR